MVSPGDGSDFYRHNGAGEMLVFSAADFEDFLQPRPDLPVDAVLFTYHEETLKVLLVERANHPDKGMWGLPGKKVLCAVNLRHKPFKSRIMCRRRVLRFHYRSLAPH